MKPHFHTIDKDGGVVLRGPVCIHIRPGTEHAAPTEERGVCSFRLGASGFVLSPVHV